MPSNLASPQPLTTTPCPGGIDLTERHDGGGDGDRGRRTLVGLELDGDPFGEALRDVHAMQGGSRGTPATARVIVPASRVMMFGDARSRAIPCAARLGDALGDRCAALGGRLSDLLDNALGLGLLLRNALGLGDALGGRLDPSNGDARERPSGDALRVGLSFCMRLRENTGATPFLPRGARRVRLLSHAVLLGG